MPYGSKQFVPNRVILSPLFGNWQAFPAEPADFPFCNWQRHYNLSDQ